MLTSNGLELVGSWDRTLYRSVVWLLCYPLCCCLGPNSIVFKMLVTAKLFFMNSSSWDPKVDDLLFSNKVTLNLLYIQTVSDVEMNWVEVQSSQETEKQLARMQVNKNFLRVK